MHSVLRFVVGIIVLALPLTATADIINVPGDQPTIQAGIDAAIHGDTVLVADGTYTGVGNRDLDYGGKAITVVSANGAENCIIDCQGSAAEPHRGVIFHNGEGTDSVFQGFTVSNGYRTTGGGISIENSSPSIIDCIVTTNEADDDGGGVYCLYSSPEIFNCRVVDNVANDGGGMCFTGSSGSASDCIVENNTATAYAGGLAFKSQSDTAIENCSIQFNTSSTSSGGGIACWDASTPSIISCSIASNEAFWGGGIYCEYESNAMIYNCMINGNTATRAGGIYCQHTTDAWIVGCQISGNTATSDCGGGIRCGQNSSPYIISCSITGNIAGASGEGGGLACYGDCSPILFNCLFESNTAGSNGGGVICSSGSSPSMANCTMVSNVASARGGAIYADREYTSPTILDSILWDNSAPSGSEVFLRNDEFGAASLAISYSNVMGGYNVPYVLVEDGCSLDWGEGMIYEDPLFTAGPLGDYYLSQVLAGQPADSPCFDTGSDLAANIGLAIPDGIVRMGTLTSRTDQETDTGQVDMGCHFNLLPVSSNLTCTPDTGTLPFTTQVCVSMSNVIDFHRTFAGRMNLTLASGTYFSNWRVGYTNMSPYENYVTCWYQQLPALGSLLGDNLLELKVQDVTAAPYNQPPYPPAGDTDSSSCTVTGLAP